MEIVRGWLELFADPTVREVQVNGCRGIRVICDTRRYEHPSPEISSMMLIEQVQEFAMEEGVRLDPNCPSAGSVTKDFLRWHAVIPPAARNEPCFVARRHLPRARKLEEFAWAGGTRDLIDQIMTKKQSLLICGSAFSGKTSLLRALAEHYLFETRLVLLESVPEIPLSSSLWVGLQQAPQCVDGRGGFDLSDALDAALRLTPERIVLGEVRLAEFKTLFEVNHVGHGGVLATIHASRPSDIVARLAQRKLDSEGYNLCFLRSGPTPKVVRVSLATK